MLDRAKDFSHDFAKYRDMGSTHPYRTIVDYYGDRRAFRSGVHLINHIDEGLVILEALGADDTTKSAYCLHPIFQAGPDLAYAYERGWHKVFSVDIMMHVMEYRNRANRYLCAPLYDNSNCPNKLNTAVIPGVRLMLIADKIQNKKDFMAHHHNNHKHSDVLETYFNNWFRLLELSDEEVTRLTNLIT